MPGSQSRTVFAGATDQRHQLGVQAITDLPKGLELDARVRHATRLARLPPVASGEESRATLSSTSHASWRKHDED